MNCKYLMDERGTLGWTEGGNWVRAYWMTGMKPDTKRGVHAHRRTTRLFVCVRGEFTLSVETKSGEGVLIFLREGESRLVPPGAWTTLSDFRYDTTVLVLADQTYDPMEIDYDYKTWQEES